MSTSGAGPHPLAGWLEAQAAFARLVASGAAADPAGLASQGVFADAYRRLMPVQDLLSATVPPSDGSAALLRFQAALQRFGLQLNEAAADAGRRFAIALAASGPEAPPIANLRELRALWIDCGEAAWSEIAHGEAFAVALAELLAAWAALRAAGRPA